MPVLRVVVQMVLALALTVAFQLVLRARLPPERRARGWNRASWGAAVYAFGPASMLGFFWVTRAPGARGAAVALIAGLLSAAAVVGVLAGVDEVFERVSGPGSWR